MGKGALAVFMLLLSMGICPGKTQAQITNSWSCGCSGIVYNVALVVSNHPMAAWSTSLASADGALLSCQNGDPTATLINPNTVDIDCLKAYRARLIAESTSVVGVNLQDSVLWLGKKNGQCVKFIPATSTIQTAPCDASDRERFLCQRPIRTSDCPGSPSMYFGSWLRSGICYNLSSCDSGYTATGATLSSRCIGTSWTPSAMVCPPVDCGQPSIPNSSSVLANAGTKYQNTATVICRTGFTGNGATGMVTCSSNRAWTGFSCGVVDCGHSTVPNSAQIKPSSQTIYQSTATVTCKLGYTSYGTSGIVTCGANGTWTGISCEAVRCGLPQNPMNGQVVVASTLFGGTATVTCDPGYTANNASATITCGLGNTTMGNWSNFTCKAVSCGHPPTPKNGNIVVDSTMFGGTATVSCNPGFTRNRATGTLRCVVGSSEVGNWSRFTCDEFLPIENVKVTRSINDFATVTWDEFLPQPDFYEVTAFYQPSDTTYLARISKSVPGISTGANLSISPRQYYAFDVTAMNTVNRTVERSSKPLVNQSDIMKSAAFIEPYMDSTPSPCACESTERSFTIGIAVATFFAGILVAAFPVIVWCRTREKQPLQSVLIEETSPAPAGMGRRMISLPTPYSGEPSPTMQQAARNREANDIPQKESQDDIYDNEDEDPSKPVYGEVPNLDTTRPSSRYSDGNLFNLSSSQMELFSATGDEKTDLGHLDESCDGIYANEGEGDEEHVYGEIQDVYQCSKTQPDYIMPT